MALPDGLYDLLVTEGLARSLAAFDASRTDVLAVKSGASEFLANVITRQLSSILDDVSGNEADKAKQQLELVNALLVMLRQRISGSGTNGPLVSGDVVDLVASPLRVLRAVQRNQQLPISPELGLAVPWLFTAGKGSPSLLQEIRRELASSDRVDILVSFITVSGVRKLQDVLQQITATGAQQPGQSKTRLRILTTTYTGATEARALDELARFLFEPQEPIRFLRQRPRSRGRTGTGSSVSDETPGAPTVESPALPPASAGESP